MRTTPRQKVTAPSYNYVNRMWISCNNTWESTGNHWRIRGCRCFDGSTTAPRGRDKPKKTYLVSASSAGGL